MNTSRCFSFIFIMFLSIRIVGQVGIGTTTPNASAIVDITSTNKGLLFPRMTYCQRNSISNPIAGLMVWCNNCGSNGQLQVYNGSSWTNFMGGAAESLPAIGASMGGGIVAYVLQPGDPGYDECVPHGLIAAPSDQSSSAEWGCTGINIPGASGTAIGTGNQNTIDIVNGCSTSGIAARLCYDLVLNGYSDWYLPSKDELNKLYINRVAIGGFSETSYWSSSEDEPDIFHQYAYLQIFSNGFSGTAFKTSPVHVRAIRSF